MCLHTFLVPSYSAGVRRKPPDPKPIAALADFVQFVGRSAVSQRQRQRLHGAVAAPVTAAELDGLRAVRKQDPVTMTALADRLSLDRTTVSRVVSRLEELELVTRTTDATDRRRTWVSVAPAGKDLLEALDQVSTQDYVVATSEWTAEERAVLGELLTRLRRDLQRLRFDADGWAIGLQPDARSEAETPSRGRSSAGAVSTSRGGSRRRPSPAGTTR